MIRINPLASRQSFGYHLCISSLTCSDVAPSSHSHALPIRRQQPALRGILDALVIARANEEAMKSMITFEFEAVAQIGIAIGAGTILQTLLSINLAAVTVVANDIPSSKSITVSLGVASEAAFVTWSDRKLGR